MAGLRRAAWSTFALAGLLALLPAAASCLMATTHRDTPVLRRTSRQRTLQFARYCIHHGMRPVAPARYLLTDFVFRNSGTVTIRIGKIERSCGCLAPSLDRSELQPGEVGQMSVSVEMAGEDSGFHEYQLTVHYEDAQPKQETLLIKAIFPEPEVQLTPRALRITQRTDETFRHPFTITDHRKAPLRVLAVESTSPHATPAIESVEKDGQITRVDVQFAGGVPAGEHRILLTAHTDDPTFSVLTMPVLLRGPERPVEVIAEPSMVRMKIGDTVSQTLRLRIPLDWSVSHVDCFPPELQAAWQEPHAGSSHQLLELSLRLNGEPEPGVREGVVTVNANDGHEMASVRVEIVGQ